MIRKEIALNDIDASHAYMRGVGFSDIAVPVAALAVTLAGSQLLKFHGASKEVLKVVRKTKEGDTPVTVADRLAEESILGVIGRFFPDHQINAEESGVTSGTSNFEWHVDPLDGTSAFLRMHRDSTVGVVLYKGDRPQVAALCQPFDRELQLAEVDKGAYSYPLSRSLRLIGVPRKLHVSDKSFTDKGLVVFMDPNWNIKALPYKLEFMRRLTEYYRGNNLQIRTPGSNIYLEARVAAGFGEAALTDFVGGFYDLAVGGFMIEQAGGKYTDSEGKPVTLQTQVAIGTNGKIHDDMLEIVSNSYEGYKGFK